MNFEIVLLISVIVVHCNAAPINIMQGRGFSMDSASDTGSDDDDLPISSSKVIKNADGSEGLEIKLDFTRGGKAGGKQLGGNVLDLSSILSTLFKKGLLQPMGSSGGLPPKLGLPQNMAGERAMPMQNGGQGGGFQFMDFSKSRPGSKVLPGQVGSSGGPPPGWVMVPKKSGGSGGPISAGLNNQRGPVPTTSTTTTTTTQAPASNNDEGGDEILDDKK